MCRKQTDVLYRFEKSPSSIQLEEQLNVPGAITKPNENISILNAV